MSPSSLPYLTAWARRTRQPELRFQNAYVWLVFVSSLDIMLTWLILNLGGMELNPIADAILLSTGFHGMIAFKFAVIVLFVVLCETVGRLRYKRGRWLSRVAVVICAAPVVVALPQIAAHSATSFFMTL